MTQEIKHEFDSNTRLLITYIGNINLQTKCRAVRSITVSTLNSSCHHSCNLCSTQGFIRGNCRFKTIINCKGINIGCRCRCRFINERKLHAKRLVNLRLCTSCGENEIGSQAPRDNMCALISCG